MTSDDRLKRLYLGSAVSAALLCFVLTACTRRPPGPDVYALQGETMGTTWHAKMVVPAERSDITGEGMADAIQAALDAVNDAMSTYNPDSELSRLNRHPAGEPFQLSTALGEVLGLALALCEETGGAFDPTVGPIVNAYGFGPDQPDAPPTEAELEALDAFVGCDHLAFDRAANTVTKSHPEVYCDLSAVAKGYAVDRAADALDALEVQDYMIEVGGEVVARGDNDRGQPWRIAVERPVAESHVAQDIVSLGAGQSGSGGHGARWALATSGDYRNYFMEGDKRVSHTIDPRTHRPIDHTLASASVIHSSCARADGYATALMVLGDEADDFADGEADLSAFFIRRAGETFETSQSKRWPGLPHN